MPLSEPITPGVVDWTGENPGILLKNAQGDFSAMALFFRVAWSPVGQGQVLLLYGTPEAAARLERVLWNDPASGVWRHADAGYEEAIACAKEHQLRLPGILDP